ncbi:MAG TPA: HAMP domain-containing sensor histidine kinase [Polyangiaceae bacterium]|jgi:signal transduction histidine kinase
MRPLSKDRHLLSLVGAFALVAVVFLVAAVVAQRATAQIDTELVDLRTNSLPSVTYLAKARTEMGHLVPEIEALTDLPPGARRDALVRMAKIRGELEADVDTYAETPWYAGERDVFDGQLRPSLQRFDDDVRRLGDLGPEVDAGVRQATERRLFVDADAAEEALGTLLDLNHEQAYVAIANILREREHSVQLAIALEIGSALVAAVAAWLAIRTSRHFEGVLRENAVLQTARAEEFESFAQRVAHDLLSPMSGVVFSLGAIERRHPDPATKEVVQRTLRSLGRSRQMVHGIFNFARSGARPAAGARAALRSGVHAAVEELFASELSSPPLVQIEPFDECEVTCDEAVLQVILSNLLSNAEKYTRDSPVRRVTVRAHVAPDRARIEVEDTGPGLPPGLEHSIFEPYVRAPGVTQPGLGLGLATVKRFVDRHGGRVGVARAEAGTVFWFELPRAAAGPGVKTPPSGPASTNPGA